MQMIKTDVIIIGSGISGLVLSLLLKRKRINHIVLDRIHKQKVMALAETLPPSAMTLLQDLDLLELFEQNALKKTYGYHALWGSNQLQTTHFFNSNPFKYGLKIDKQAIQNNLKQQTKEHILRYDILNALKVDSKKVTVTISHEKQQQTVEGTLIVDATGRKRTVLSALQIPAQEHDTMMAFSCHVPRIKHPNLVHDVFTESFEDGWGIISGLNENTQVFTIFTNKETGVHKQLTDYSNWKSILSNTQYLKDFLTDEVPDTITGGKASSSTSECFAGERWLAIGDAAMAYDPLSSHGITNAIYTAKLAKHYITQSPLSLDTYDKDLNAIFASYIETKKIVYKQEQRWPDSIFWKSVQNQILV